MPKLSGARQAKIAARTVKNMIVGTDHDQPVYLYQVAKVTDGPGEPRQYVSFSYGAAETKEKVKMPDDYSAVTVSIAKKKGADAMKLADAVISKVKHLKCGHCFVNS